MVRVSLRTVTMNIPPQDVITKDNVTVKVNAVAYFNVVVPLLSVTAVENHVVATSQIAQTTLRSILGQANLDDLLVDRDSINQRLQTVTDEITSAWGGVPMGSVKQRVRAFLPVWAGSECGFEAWRAGRRCGGVRGR